MVNQFATKYRTKGDELNDEYFNTRFRDIDLRISALEAVLGQLQDAADTLLRIGMQRLNQSVDTAITEFQAKADAIEATATQLQTQVTALEDRVAGLLGTLGEEFHLDGGTF